MKSIIKFSVLILLSLFIYFNTYSQDCTTILTPSVKKSETKLCHTHYCFVYSEKHEQSKWVAYILKDYMTESNAKRTDKFMTDPLVATGTANDNDYKNSGYDKGHLLPAADMSFDSIAMVETFYFSNMSPQAPSFNRGIWKNLETYVRTTSSKLGCIYVVTGPVLENDLENIGENKVSVPKYFYKTILYHSDTLTSGIAFLIPNEKATDKDIFSYTLSIRDLEKTTKLNFWHTLPRSMQNKVEKNTDFDFWKQFAK
ncbi:MAG: DNA/RNA non-specific endonuclease [Bacteroidota bacterium]|mgnify:FL=1|jgi:endonuclease G|nr:DNA/RNA non-specific endonuclease [Bacteroidales bacterium]MDI9536037.1 DNA/RNA non-specific endonuclease [Bacteroidota bacterium]OQC45179.1 MAG: Nuclease precursor [Bacteroidetes bacterium ADurb.Bin028]NLP21128.1 DNA/RNA non-specific endonuclease [Bacteroidales bacterium]HNY43563.1 DNA/RNA non-specific endonuclease [Bacteroidales bacterium]